MKTKRALLMTATLVAALGATHAFAGHGGRVVVHETHYSAPVVTYHSGPVSVYVGPTHTTRVITTSHRTQSYRHAPYGKAYGHQGRKYKDSYRHRNQGQRHYGGHDRAYYGSSHHSPYRNYQGGHTPSRSSWSRDRREVIYVNKNARKNSNYRHVERNSVVIRERRR